MSVTYNSNPYSCFPTYNGQPDYSLASIAIAEGVMELLRAKYDYIRPKDHSRPYPCYELHAVLNRPRKIPIETVYAYPPRSSFQYVPAETSLVVLGELSFYGEAAQFLTHLYHDFNCLELAPYSFECVLEYNDPAMIERLWAVLDTVVMACYADPVHPQVDMGEMRRLGNIKTTRRVGDLAWDGQWKIVKDP